MAEITGAQIGAHLDARIAAVRLKAETERVERRARWAASVKAASAAWRESSGYKLGPIMDHHMVKREVHEMLRTVIDGRLLMMCAPLFVMAESIDRSLLIVSMLASPSGNGPERYAPKAGAVQRFKINAAAASGLS